MEVQALSPEVIQDVVEPKVQSIAPEYLQTTFGSSTIGTMPRKPKNAQLLIERKLQT